MKDDKKKMCERCGWFMDYNEDFCPDCGVENFNIPNEYQSRGKNRNSPMGAWILVHGRLKNGKETNPPLFTKINTNDIKHKATGKRFCAGRYVLFCTLDSDIQPTFIEDTDDYQINYRN